MQTFIIGLYNILNLKSGGLAGTNNPKLFVVKKVYIVPVDHRYWSNFKH